MMLFSPVQPADSLAGARILVADDEIMIALDVECTIVEAGGVVVGPCFTVCEAIKTIENETIAAATLDLRLGTENIEPVAARLFERGVPFIFYSGQPLPAEMQFRWNHITTIIKPAHPRLIVEAITRLLA